MMLICCENLTYKTNYFMQTGVDKIKPAKMFGFEKAYKKNGNNSGSFIRIKHVFVKDILFSDSKHYIFWIWTQAFFESRLIRDNYSYLISVRVPE